MLKNLSLTRSPARVDAPTLFRIRNNEIIKAQYSFCKLFLRRFIPTAKAEGFHGAFSVNPYRLVMTNGKYYLLGNYDKYDDISHYRVDRITCVKMLDEPIKPLNQIKEFNQIGFNLPRHTAEHIYMYSGESVWVKFVADIGMMDELVDWFGKNFRIEKIDDKKIRVNLKCNEQAMIYWALQYGNDIVIESPQSLIDSVKQIAEKIVANYT